MPIRPSAFASLSRHSMARLSYVNLGAIRLPEARPDFDWGFELDVPWERLSVFTRHIDTSAPLARVPIFGLVEFGLNAKSAALIDDAELLDRLRFPSLPLGAVGTDHVGYASFDLWPLRNLTVLQSLKAVLTTAGLLAAGRPRLTIGVERILVLPYKDPALAFDALTEGDVAPDFVCLRMDLDVAMLARRDPWPAMPSMQTPSIDDWRLSPGSFSMAGALLIGEDGCETLLPANLATRMVRFRQLVRTRSEAAAEGGQEGPRFGFSGAVRLGYGVNYQSEWFPVGHSLGQIAYSLPLAPGEKMKIAVVDWSRRDAAKRSEQTAEKEDLQHAALRDRTITEAVNMVVRESQSGSSFMAGGALSAGAGIPIGPISLGVGSSFGAGGASTDSEGMRSIVGDTTQRISDAFNQASSAQRELNSTVVIQADQAEGAQARTRMVANYNHSHALTIVYYEVLQHYRVLTRPASVRPTLFLKHEATRFSPSWDQDADYALIERHLGPIAAHLLDESLRGCLEVVRKRACLKINFSREAKRRDQQGVPSDDYELGEFSFWVLSGAVGPEFNLFVRIHPKAGGTPIDCAFTDLSIVASTPQYGPNGSVVGNVPVPTVLANFASNPHPVRPNEEFLATLRPTQKIRWGNVAAIEVGQTIAPAHRVEFHNGQPPADWVVQKMRFGTQQGADRWTMFDGTPAPASVKWDGSTRANVIGFTAPLRSVDDDLSNEERCCLARLVDHLNAHAGHYWQVIWLSELPADRAVRLERWSLAGVPLLDLIDNTLLGVDGEHLVMPIAAGAELALDRVFQTENLGVSTTPYLEYVEQLLTVPARGVFAEAKLGHCNASELIDPSRFWDWQTSPIPDDAPDIAPSSTDTRYQDHTKGLASTPFPTPIVNIVNPQALPDPSGFVSASGVLSALGPFRDMSGVKELGAYLSNLSDNATQLASQGLKNAQTAGLMNTIRSAKELSPQQRSDLMSELLTGQVKQHNAPLKGPELQPPVEPKPQPPGEPKPQPPVEPKPTPAPAPPKGVLRPAEPKPPTVLGPKTRRLAFTFVFDTGQEMWGNYQIELQDTQAGKLYIPSADPTYTNIMFIDLPASVKAGVIVRVNGQVKPTSIVAPSNIEPKIWSLAIQRTEQFGNVDGVTGFNVIGQTKDVNFELTLETENQNTTAKSDSDEYGASIKLGGTVKVVEIEGEGAYKYTKTSETTTIVGNKEVNVSKFTVRALDRQKQPKIEAVK